MLSSLGLLISSRQSSNDRLRQIKRKIKENVCIIYKDYYSDIVGL